MKLKNKKTGEIVIHFEDTNECQDFYNKLLAWKRLKDEGFKFDGIRFRNGHNYIEWHIENNDPDKIKYEQFVDDLHFVFRGKK